MEVFLLDLCPVYVGCVRCVGTEVSHSILPFSRE